MLTVHFVYFADLYLIARRCDSAFFVATSAVVDGTTVKMVQNTVHCGLILQKVSIINDKDNYKTVTKNSPHGLISV